MHPAGYLLCQLPLRAKYPGTPSALLSPEELVFPGATVAIPFDLCPGNMQLTQQQHQQEEDVEEGGQGLGPGQQQLQQELYDAEEQQRWKPWELGSVAAGGVTDSDTGTAAVAASAAGASMMQSHQCQLQEWRQGVLGLWRQPYLMVKVQLLPLEQQLDPQLLAKAVKAVEWSTDAAQRARQVVRKAGSECDMSPTGVGLGFTPNLPLLARIVE